MFDRIKSFLKFNKNINNSTNVNDFFSDMLAEEKSVDPLNESTYLICMKILSESLAKLPLKAYKKTGKGGRVSIDHDILNIVAFRPNEYTSSSVFWANVELRRNHYGNAFVYLKFSGRGKNKGKLEGMYILDNDKVDVIVDNKKIISDIPNGIFYRFNNDLIFSSDEILHFKTSICLDGVNGISVREQLANMIGTLKYSSDFFGELNKNGMTGKIALNYSADLSKEKINKMVENTKAFFDYKNSAINIIPVPPGMELKPLNISLNDAQFLENKKYLGNQIASCFGIKPYFLNEYSNGGSSNFEFQNTSFYIDTLMYILKHYEEELNYKLILDDDIKLKFNEKAILRLSAKDQMEYLKTAVNNPIMKPNEAREILQLDATEGGDVLVCNGNYIPITDVGKQYGLQNSEGKEVEDENTKQEKSDGKRRE